MPLLLIYPIYLPLTLEQWGFGGLEFWGDGLGCHLGRRSPGMQGPVIPALISGLHQLEELVCLYKTPDSRVVTPYGADCLPAG